MAKINAAYDHPNYLVHKALCGQVSGNAGATRFTFYTAAKLKSITVKPATAGTSNDAATAICIDGTTTTTVATWTFGSAATTGTNIAIANTAISTNGVLTVTKGTDATAVLAVCVEVLPDPGSDFED